jgi:hypothetical protein
MASGSCEQADKLSPAMPAKALHTEVVKCLGVMLRMAGFGRKDHLATVRCRTDLRAGHVDDAPATPAQPSQLQCQMPGVTAGMDIHTHHARITAPIAHRTGKGRKQNIPVGPCLIESMVSPSIDVIWGEQGERSAALPSAEVEAAQHHGQLVLLD